MIVLSTGQGVHGFTLDPVRISVMGGQVGRGALSLVALISPTKYVGSILVTLL